MAEKDEDGKKNITLIASKSQTSRIGDIFYEETWKIFDELTGGSVDLIFSRPAGGYLNTIRELGETVELDLFGFYATKLNTGGYAFLQRFIGKNSANFQSWISHMSVMGYKVHYLDRIPIGAVVIERIR